MSEAGMGGRPGKFTWASPRSLKLVQVRVWIVGRWAKTTREEDGEGKKQ